jgi:hypothetical protein
MRNRWDSGEAATFRPGLKNLRPASDRGQGAAVSTCGES